MISLWHERSSYEYGHPAKECVVLDYIKCAVLDVLVPNQYGAVLNSSTTQALIHMLHDLSKKLMETALQLELFSLILEKCLTL